MTKFSIRSALIVWLVLSVIACGASTTPAANTPFAASTPTRAPTVATSATAPLATAVVQPSAGAQTASPSPAATATVPGSPTSGQTRAINSLTAGLQALKSYRLSLLFDVDAKDSSGNRQVGTLEIVEVIDNTGRSLQTSSKASGNLNNGYGTNGVVYETYFLDGTTFLVENGKCRFLSKKPFTGLAGSMILPDDYVNGIGNAALTRRGETVNAVLTDHYTFSTGALGRQLKGMVFSQGDAWLATDGYVVRLRGQAIGKDQYGAEGAATVSYNMDSINQPITIKAPANCVAP